MVRSLSSLVPNATDLLGLEVEELAGVLLIHLNGYEGVSGNSINQHGGISRHNLFSSLTPLHSVHVTRHSQRAGLAGLFRALMSNIGRFILSSGRPLFEPESAVRAGETANTDFTTIAQAEY